MNKLRTAIRIWKFLFSYEKYHMVWAGGLIITGLYPTATAWLSKQVINSIIAPQSPIVLGVANAFVFAAAYGLITVFQGVINSYSTVELLSVKDRTIGLTDQLLMNKAASSHDVAAFEVSGSRDRIRLASAGARALPSAFYGMVEVLQYLITVLGLSVILVCYHPVVAAIVFLPALPLFYTQVTVRAHTFSVLVHKSPAYRRMGYFIELMLGMAPAKEVRIYRSGGFFLKKYQRAADDIFKLQREQRWKATLATLIWGSVAAAGIGGAYLYIIYLAAIRTVTVGDVVMYSSAVFYAGSSLRSLIQATSSLWATLLEVESFFSYLDEELPDPSRKPLTAPVVDAGGEEWVLNHVSFSYPGRGDKVIEDVSFVVGPKEKVAIVGLNGAGKTTLMKLMLRLLDPDEGDIRFRGTDLRDWDISSLRKQFGVVFQDFSRFKLTLYENLALAVNGRQSVESRDAAILRAAKLTGVDDIAKAAPLGYETPLGKEFLNGTDLSGGQWQKIALARGFVRDASVVFLDEPSASLDAKAEQALFEQLLSLAQDKTAIIISHRLSITPLVDRVLVLERGHLIEEGTHEQLMRRDGVYAFMYRTQAEMYWPKAE